MDRSGSVCSLHLNMLEIFHIKIMKTEFSFFYYWPSTNTPEHVQSVHTIIFIRALGMAIDRIGFAMRCPTGMSYSKVYIKFYIQIHILLF